MSRQLISNRNLIRMRPATSSVAGRMPLAPGHPELFPRRAVNEFPANGENADYLGEVEADDGLRYFVKGDCFDRPMRASEWLATSIAEQIGIPSAPIKVIQRLDGSLVVGSQNIAGTADHVATASFLTRDTEKDDSRGVSLSALISGIYAYDLFIYNDDRHLGNYISVQDGSVRRLFAIDYSRALLLHWPLTGFPTSGHTRRYGKLLIQLHGFDSDAALRVLDGLARIQSSWVEHLLSRIPEDWISEAAASEFVDWWASDARTARLQDVRSGMLNGTLL